MSEADGGATGPPQSVQLSNTELATRLIRVEKILGGLLKEREDSIAKLKTLEEQVSKISREREEDIKNKTAAKQRKIEKRIAKYSKQPVVVPTPKHIVAETPVQYQSGQTKGMSSSTLSGPSDATKRGEEDWELNILEKMDLTQPNENFHITFTDEEHNMTVTIYFENYHIVYVKAFDVEFHRVKREECPLGEEYPGGAYFMYQTPEGGVDTFCLTCDLGEGFVGVVLLSKSISAVQVYCAYSSNKIIFC